MNQQNDAISISNRNIQISIDNLTAMMTGAKGGYKLTEYDEDGRWLRDLYMDTPDKATAKRIMQINKDEESNLSHVLERCRGQASQHHLFRN